MDYETTREMEVAVARYFNARKNVIVPNVSWGMFKYEMDLCMLNMVSMYASEVEIKVSKADLKADAKKEHHHDSPSIKYLWFAMPDKMVGCEDLVPENAGIIYINKHGYGRTFRKPKANAVAQRWDFEKAFKLARLGTLRIWDLKEACNKAKRDCQMARKQL